MNSRGTGLCCSRLAWCTDRSPDAHDTQALELLPEFLAIDRIPVVDQMTGTVLQGVALITCCQTQAEVGLAVTLKWTSSLREWVMKKSTYKVRNPPTSKSAAHIPFSSLVRNVRHLWVPTGFGGRQRYLRIDRLLTTIPSLRSSPRFARYPRVDSLWRCGR
jgi:hypothetical protein